MKGCMWIPLLAVQGVWWSVMVTGQAILRQGTGDNPVHYSARWRPCGGPEHADVSSRVELASTDVKSKIDCVRRCYKDLACEVIAYVGQTNSDAKTCHLMAAVSDGVVNNLDLNQQVCEIAALNPCEHGGSVRNGLCECPVEYTGQYCQFSNHATCTDDYELVHAYGALTPLNGVASLQHIHSRTVKIYLKDVTPGISYTGPSHFHVFQSQWGAQVLGLLSKANLSTYDTPTHLNYYAVNGDANFFTLGVQVDGTGQTLSVQQVTLEVRARPLAHQVVVRDGQSGGTVNDVIAALSDGYQLLEAGTATLDTSNNVAIQHKVTLAWSLAKAPKVNDAYFFNSKISTSGEGYIHRNFFSSTDNFVSLEYNASASCPVPCPTLEVSSAQSYTVYTIGRETDQAQAANNYGWTFDPCWYPATRDPRRESQADTTIRHLRKSLQAGRRARLVVDGVSGQTQAVYMTDNFVLFQLGPYMTPKLSATINGNITYVRLLASTDGRVKTCSHMQTPSDAISQTDYHTDKLEWFVDSRQWDLALHTHLNGSLISGDQNMLKSRLHMGADLQIVVDLPTGVTFSLPGGWMEMNDVGPGISAEITGTMSVDISQTDFSFVSPDYCTRVNYLISDTRGLQCYEFSPGSGGPARYVDLSAGMGDIRWYISGSRV